MGIGLSVSSRAVSRARAQAQAKAPLLRMRAITQKRKYLDRILSNPTPIPSRSHRRSMGLQTIENHVDLDSNGVVLCVMRCCTLCDTGLYYAGLASKNRGAILPGPTDSRFAVSFLPPDPR